MNIMLIAITIIFSIFSTGVMTYIALATPIGPWIAPTLVLIGTFFMRLTCLRDNQYTQGLALATAGGSIGGILATALAFSFPTLFFLDAPFFNQLMGKSTLFALMITSLAVVGGSFGFLIADLLDQKMIVDDKLAFPIGQLTYKMISAQNQIRKSLELAFGAFLTVFFTVLHTGLYLIRPVIPGTFTLVKKISSGPVTIPLIQLRMDVLPMLLAIGFITGHVIALPLIVGAVTRIFLMEPLNVVFFAPISANDFMLAFSSGLVAVGVIQSFFDVPRLLGAWFSKMRHFSQKPWYNTEFFAPLQQRSHAIQGFVTLATLVGFFSLLKFGLIAQLYLIFFSFMCAYQIVVIAGEIGLAQLGRFATFVMVPALFIFSPNPLQITVIATFVELCGGVATDILFGRKMAYMAGISRARVRNYQLLGLIVSSLTAGVVFWLLVNRFGLGVEPLFAQRSHARALLINVTHFDWLVLAIGGVFGLVLKKCKLNPMLVLGGLLMPITYSIGLIIGGIFSYAVQDRQDWEPFWSGVFAANSITELAKTFI